MRAKLKNILAKIHRPGKIQATQYLETGDFPVIDQGQNLIAGYTNDETAVISSPLPITVFGDHTRAVKIAKHPFACGADGTQLLYPSTSDIDPTWFYYAVKNVNLANYFYARHFKFLKDQEIDIPSLHIQKSIAVTLSAYDDLIENNRRRTKLLEESARLLYREWFVHFRFPGHEHIGIKDGVPSGWSKTTISDLAHVTMGQSPESRYYNEVLEGLPFHQGVTDFGDRFTSNRVYTTAENRIANAGDILCSVRAPVGKLNITLDKIVIGRGLAALRSKSDNQIFLFYQLRNHFQKEDMIGTGAIFASVKKKEFEGQQLITPTSNLILAFEDILQPIDRQIEMLFLQNQRLSKARDILLPKLMSGEVSV